MRGHVWFVQAGSILSPSTTRGARSLRVRRGVKRKRRAKAAWRGGCIVGWLIDLSSGKRGPKEKESGVASSVDDKQQSVEYL